MITELMEMLGAEWNRDPEWADYIESLNDSLRAIATKYTSDFSLRDDVIQDAKIVLLHKYPEEIRGFEKYSNGELDEEQWQGLLRGYCLKVARNVMLSSLSSYTTGNLYSGRKRILTRVVKGREVKIQSSSPARFVSLDMLVEDHGLQVSETGDISWDSVDMLETDD